MVELDKKITSATEFSNIQSQYLSGVPIKRIEWKVRNVWPKQVKQQIKVILLII